MPNPWDTEPPVPPTPTEAPKPWETAAPNMTPPSPAMAHALVQNAPGAKDAQTPWDAFMAGLHSSASGMIASGGKSPDLQVPQNASFAMKLSNALGSGAGDLPFNVAGAIGGAAGGGSAGAAVGSAVPVVGTAAGAATGTVVGGGAGSLALPQAVRETMMDYYKVKNSGGNMTASDVIGMIAHSSWEVGKAGVTGAVAGKAGALAGDVAAPLASDFINPAFARTAGNVTGFTLGATGAQSVISGHLPDAKDFTASAIASLPFAMAGHYAPTTGKFEPTAATDSVTSNMEHIFRQTGVPPWEQAHSAGADPKLDDELKSQDVNGEPVATKFNATRPPEHEPYKTNPGKIAAEHEADMAGIWGQGNVGAHVEELLPQIKTLEGSGDQAISPKGAIGRYQIMPGTARQYMGQNFDLSTLHDPAVNEKVARVVLSDLSRRFNGDTEAVLVAYNAGPSRAFHFINDGRDTSQLPRETQNYLTHAGYGGKGGEPPEPPEPPQEPEPVEGGGQDFSKLDINSLRARFLDRQGVEPEVRKSFFGNPFHQFVSELESARGIDQTMKRAGLLDPQKDLNTEDMFRQTYASDDRSNYMFTKGNIDPITLDAKEGPALTDVLGKIKDAGGNLDDFNMYRVAKRTLDLNDRGIDTGVFKGGVAEAGRVLQVPEMQKYKAINEDMQTWKLGGLEYGRDSGLWNQARVEAMQAASSHVSLRRIMGDDAAFNVGQSGKSKFRATNPLKAMEGSDRQIENPLTADMDNLRQIIRMSDRNRAIGHVLGAQEALMSKGTDLGFKQLPAAEVKAMMAEPGSSVFKPYNMTPEQEAAAAPFAIEGRVGAGRLANSFVYYRNGIPEVWNATDPDLARLMRGADTPGEADWLTNTFVAVAKLQRAGILSAPDFAFRVPMRHQLTAWALDPLHPAPYLTAIRGSMDVLGKGDAYWDLMRRGGLSGAITDMDMAKATDAAVGNQETLTQTGALEKTWNTVTHPLHLAQIVTEKLTQMERVGYYKTATKMGIDPNKAAMMGRKAYLDFSEKSTGAVANWFAKTIPFFRASMLGLRQGRDAIVDRPGQTALYGSALAAFQVANYVLNKKADQGLDDKDKYSSLPQWERDQFFITPPIGGTRFRLARPYVIGPMIGTPVERFLESDYDKDPHAYDSWFSSTFGDVTPSVLPAAVRAPMEQATNHNFFTGLPLVSDSLKSATADQQYQENTSEVAKRVSSLLGSHRGLGVTDVSPIVLDNYVQEWSGSTGGAILHALDAPLGKQQPDQDWRDMPFVRGFVIQNPRMGTKQISDFYRDAEKWQALHTDVSLEKKRQDIAGAEQDQSGLGQRASMIVHVEHAINVQRTALQAIAKRQDLNVDEKRQLSERIYQDAWQVARFGSRALAGDIPTDADAQGLSDRVQQNVTNAVGDNAQQ